MENCTNNAVFQNNSENVINNAAFQRNNGIFINNATLQWKTLLLMLHLKRKPY